MPMPRYIDIAVNLLSPSLINQAETIIQDAEQRNVTPLIVIGSDIEESQNAIKLARQYPNKLFTTAGVHPHQASTWNDTSAALLTNLAAMPEVVAIGECGLDYNRDFSPRDKQKQAFAAQLALAAELNMPVLMHCRDAFDDFIEILTPYRMQLPNALLHCFTGTEDELNRCLALDLHIGITGWVCDERRGQELAAIVALIPADKLMVETDSPYLLPRSMRPKPKSSKNLPQYLPYIVEQLAQLRGVTHEEVAEHCYQNSCSFFTLEPLR
jgi:TatD DNase family protein